MTASIIGLLILAAPDPGVEAPAAPVCPAGLKAPQLKVADIKDPVVPVVDTWQVFLGDVPLSDYQVATMAGEKELVTRSTTEMADRGTWVYIGMGVAAAGTAVSSAGWVLYGQNELSQGVTVPMAAGGLLLGMLGVLMVTESIQRPLEPLVAPTPTHRLTRDEVRTLVERINNRIHADICGILPDSNVSPSSAHSLDPSIAVAGGPRRPGPRRLLAVRP